MTGISEQAKLTIKEYLQLDNKITEFENSLKKLKIRKAQLQASVFKYMRQNDIKQVNLPHGAKLQTYTRKSRTGTSKKWVEQRLTEYCLLHKINYTALHEFIYLPEHRPQIEKVSIKRTKGKKPKK